MNTSPKKILVVEDAMMVGLHLKKSLEHVGYEVIATVTNGAAALEAAMDRQPDLILMDIMLEGDLDGIETARLIRREREIPIIYLTALSDMETIRRAKITDPFGYIMKPFNERELHTNIEMALHKDAADRKLRASEAKFYSTVRSIPSYLLTLDGDMVISFANHRLTELLGVEAEALVGQSLGEVLHPTPLRSTRKEEVSPWWKPLITRGLLRGPCRLEEASPDLYFGEFRLVPLFPSEEQDHGYLITFRDITAEYRNQELEREMERRTLAKLIEGQEQERTRVARDLHDSLGQMLSGIKLHVENTLTKEDPLTSVEQLQKMLDDAIHETRRISENLIPIHLQELPLRDCLAGLVKSMEKLTPAKVTYHAMGTVLDVPHRQKIGVYRIVQEGLNNAIKYARSENINVQLVLETDSLDLTIEDDGRGFDLDTIGADSSRIHYGVRNMNDRARIMNGELTLESSPQLGTLIHLMAPIANEETEL